MSKKKIYLIVKAYPEKSTKHGSSICTAGITDENEWIRIYPVDLNYYSSNKDLFKKWNLIEADVIEASEKLMRKESHKVKETSIKLIDNSLTNTSKKDTWDQRNSIIIPKISSSVEELERKKQEDHTSLGLIKPKEFEFYIRKEINEIKVEKTKTIQRNLDGAKLISPDKIEKVFAYKFKCNNPECKGHDMICEDWEVIEAFRSWKKKYDTADDLENALINKFDTEMKEKKDLHFILGTTSQFGTWVIIGLHYPPKNETKKIISLTSFY
jgi:hypothetical protein